MYKEIERLHAVLSTKTNELMQMTKEYNMLEERYRVMESKMNSSSSERNMYEQKIEGLQMELLGEKRRCGDLGVEI